MNESQKGTARRNPGGSHYPWWTPRFWHGMRLRTWLGLLHRNGYRIHPARVPMCLLITGFAAANSVFYRLQQAVYGRKIASTPIAEPPIFIIGHWRSGTTYLHELMSLDERFTSPTTLECYAPNHVLLSDWLVSRWMGFLLPRERPSDAVALGWSRPQEDEFALCNLGAPSPYLRMAFPYHPPVHQEYLDMEDLSPAEMERWRRQLIWFLRLITFRRGKRVVLKSPPHTGRIAVLREMFPGAKFIHIVRNPLELFPSTMKLWRSLDKAQGAQLRENPDLKEFVFESLTRMYRAFERHRGDVPANQICDLRYEDLVRDPVGELRRVYEQLELGDFEPVRQRLEEYTAGVKDYQRGSYELPEPLQREIAERWADYFARYGYAAELASPAGRG